MQRFTYKILLVKFILLAYLIISSFLVQLVRGQEVLEPLETLLGAPPPDPELSQTASGDLFDKEVLTTLSINYDKLVGVNYYFTIEEVLIDKHGNEDIRSFDAKGQPRPNDEVFADMVVLDKYIAERRDTLNNYHLVARSNEADQVILVAVVKKRDPRSQALHALNPQIDTGLNGKELILGNRDTAQIAEFDFRQLVKGVAYIQAKDEEIISASLNANANANNNNGGAGGKGREASTNQNGKGAGAGKGADANNIAERLAPVEEKTAEQEAEGVEAALSAKAWYTSEGCSNHDITLAQEQHLFSFNQAELQEAGTIKFATRKIYNNKTGNTTVLEACKIRDKERALKVKFCSWNENADRVTPRWTYFAQEDNGGLAEVYRGCQYFPEPNSYALLDEEKEVYDKRSESAVASLIRWVDLNNSGLIEEYPVQQAVADQQYSVSYTQSEKEIIERWQDCSADGQIPRYSRSDVQTGLVTSITYKVITRPMYQNINGLWEEIPDTDCRPTENYTTKVTPKVIGFTEDNIGQYGENSSFSFIVRDTISFTDGESNKQITELGAGAGNERLSSTIQMRRFPVEGSQDTLTMKAAGNPNANEQFVEHTLVSLQHKTRDLSHQRQTGDVSTQTVKIFYAVNYRDFVPTKTSGYQNVAEFCEARATAYFVPAYYHPSWFMRAEANFKVVKDWFKLVEGIEIADYDPLLQNKFIGGNYPDFVQAQNDISTHADKELIIGELGGPAKYQQYQDQFGQAKRIYNNCWTDLIINFYGTPLYPTRYRSYILYYRGISYNNDWTTGIIEGSYRSRTGGCARTEDNSRGTGRRCVEQAYRTIKENFNNINVERIDNAKLSIKYFRNTGNSEEYLIETALSNDEAKQHFVLLNQLGFTKSGTRTQGDCATSATLRQPRCDRYVMTESGFLQAKNRYRKILSFIPDLPGHKFNFASKRYEPE